MRGCRVYEFRVSPFCPWAPRLMRTSIPDVAATGKRWTGQSRGKCTKTIAKSYLRPCSKKYRGGRGHCKDKLPRLPENPTLQSFLRSSP